METRGIRNCNPLNIRIGNNWKGERPTNSDGVFEQFTDMRYGLRAAFILIRRYITKYKLCTIRAIISRWAPETENLTMAYINFSNVLIVAIILGLLRKGTKFKRHEQIFSRLAALIQKYFTIFAKRTYYQL